MQLKKGQQGWAYVNSSITRVGVGSLHSGRDVVRLGSQQIKNAILGNFEKKFPFHTTAMPCQEDRLAVVSIEKKTDEFK